MSQPLAEPAAVNPPVVLPKSTNAIIINPCQRLNPILETIKNVNKEFGDIVPDFQVGRTTGVLFLSLKYHRLHPEYIHQRIEKLGHMYTLRVLLLVCDISEHQDPIREITKTCLVNNITVMVAWTSEEAGYYLSTFKSFEHRPPDLIKERIDKDFPSLYRSSLTSIPKLNKTDVETIRTNIGSISDIAKVPLENMHLLPGLGRVKVRRIKDTFEKPFIRQTTTSLQNHFIHTNPHWQSKKSTAATPKLGNATHSSDATSAVDQNRPESREFIRDDPGSPIWDIELDLNESDIES